ncbi:MAG: hypothetical protein KGJ07_01940 [Patescibacteria group bacterium]|nr:hypothetical protein [Patescibacteria group bacterium]MDE2588865.1 hypothetical protein [Patescibacteria group bacterium]
MYETAYTSIPKHVDKLFTILLLLYPSQYRNKFGEDMRTIFLDLYHEELIENGNIGVMFWLTQIGDITKSSIIEHVNFMKQKGMEKYFHQTFGINKFNLIGGIFLLPLFIVTAIDVIARIVQGDLVHYNRPVYSLLSHSPLYWYPILFVWVILFPLLTVIINLIPIAQSVLKNKTKIWNVSFVKRNVISLILLCIGLGFIAMIRFHDFIPCFIHGLFKVGFGQLPKILNVCRNA